MKRAVVLLFALIGAVCAQEPPPMPGVPFTGCVLASDQMTACFDTAQIQQLVCVSALVPNGLPCTSAILDAVAATQRGLKVPCHLANDANTGCTADLQASCVNAIQPSLPCTTALINAFNAAVNRLVNQAGTPSATTNGLVPPISSTSTYRVTTFATSATRDDHKTQQTDERPPLTSSGGAANLFPSTTPDNKSAGDGRPVAAASAATDAGSPFLTAVAGGPFPPGGDAERSTGTLAPSAMFSARDIATYLGVSFAVLLILCVMAAFMTWKALQNKRRRTAAADFDADDTPMAANGDSLGLEEGDDAGMTTPRDLFHEPVPIIDDEELRWKGCDVELSPSDSGVASVASPFSATDQDAAILFGPEGSLSPPAHMLDDGDAGEPLTPTNMKKRAFQQEAEAAAHHHQQQLNGGGARHSSADVSTTSQHEPSSPMGQSVGTPVEASLSSPPSTGATRQQPQQQPQQQQPKVPPQQGRKKTATAADNDDGNAAKAPKAVRRRTTKQPEPVGASRSAIASFMSGGAQTRHLVYETQTGGGGASSGASSASSTAVSSPMDRTPSPSGHQLADPFSNIKLLET